MTPIRFDLGLASITGAGGGHGFVHALEAACRGAIHSVVPLALTRLSDGLPPEWMPSQATPAGLVAHRTYSADLSGERPFESAAAALMGVFAGR